MKLLVLVLVGVASAHDPPAKKALVAVGPVVTRASTEDEKKTIAGFQPFASDLYRRFGLEKGASADEIQGRYRQAALAFHPDRVGTDDRAREFISICEAYSILSDDAKRQRYDTTGATRNWDDYERPAAFNQDLYELMKQILEHYATVGPLAENLVAGALSFWSRFVHLAEIRRLFAEVALGKLNLGKNTRFVALQVAAHYLVVPEFEELVVQEIGGGKHTEGQTQTLMRAIAAGLKPYGASAQPLRDRIVTKLRRVADRGSVSGEVRAIVITGLESFLDGSKVARAWMLQEARSFSRGEASRAAAISVVLNHPELRATLGRNDFFTWRVFAVGIIRRHLRGIPTRRRGRASLATGVDILLSLAELDPEAAAELGRLGRRGRRRRGDLQLAEAFEAARAQREVPPEAPTDEHRDDSRDYGDPEQRLLTVRETRPRLLPATVKPDPPPGENLGISTLDEAAEKIEELAGLPEGQGAEVLATNPQAMTQITEGNARAAAMLARAQREAMQTIARATRGMNVDIRFSGGNTDCSDFLGR